MKHIKLFILANIFVLFSSVQLFANQSVRVEVFVYDELNFSAVQFQKVEIFNQLGVEISSTFTDTNGFALLQFSGNISGQTSYYVVTYAFCGEEIISYQEQISVADTVSVQFHICNNSPPSDLCFAAILVIQDEASDTVAFVDISFGYAETSLWSFGDGSMSVGSPQYHHFSEDGEYEVCLQIEDDASFCFSSTCTNLTIGEQFTDSIYGKVKAGPNLLPEGYAVLYSVADILFDIVEVSPINSGYFSFLVPRDKEYAIQFFPEFDYNYNYFPVYFPTYYSESETWETTEFVSSYPQNNLGIIQLLSYDEMVYGHGAINGEVTNNASAINQKPKVAMLYNLNNQLIKAQLVDEFGKFRFEEIPFGQYYIRIEVAGKISEIATVYISEAQPDVSTPVFYINEYDVVLDVELIEAPKIECKISPQPASDILTIEFNNRCSGKIIFYNQSMQVVDNVSIKAQKLQFDVSSWSSGLYFAIVQKNDGTTKAIKFIVSN